MANPRRPTIYVSNWSSHRTEGHHGPDRKLSIMAFTPTWAPSVGCVPWLTPANTDLLDVKAGRITGEECELAVGRVTQGFGAVADGDTLCCTCSRDDAAAGRCLVRAGWRVILDGQEVTS